MYWGLGRSYCEEECWEWVCKKWSQGADARAEKAEGCLLPLGPLQSAFWSFVGTLLQLAILPLQAAAWLLLLARNRCHFIVRKQES